VLSTPEEHLHEPMLSPLPAPIQHHDIAVTPSLRNKKNGGSITYLGKLKYLKQFHTLGKSLSKKIMLVF
jgi:hypothetical protein